MDFHAVYKLFSTTYHPDPNIQKQAEVQLKQVEATPGFIAVLLQILTSQGTELTTIQASMVQLIDSLGRVLSNDYPGKWPDFMNQVHTLLSSNNLSNVYVGLLALRQLVKVYQWKASESNVPLLEIVHQTFPVILQIAQRLLNEVSLEAAEMLRIIVKIYYSATQYELHEPLQENSSIVPWMTLMLQLFEKRIPDEIIPSDKDERQRFIWYRTQRWACRNLNRIFSRYGNPAQLAASSTKYTAFAENFIHHFGPQILREYLRQIELWVKHEIWLSDKILYLCSDFFKDAEMLVAQFIFPQLCFSDEDEELWVDDPVEYIHKRMDLLEDFTLPSVAAVTFLMDLARHRKKFTFMGIMGFVNSVLTTYHSAPPEEKNPRQKDGALKMIGCLSDMVLRKKFGVAHLMEGFFTTHVFPEFQSQYPYLRARACDMLVKFEELDFEHESSLATAYQGVTTLREAIIPNLPTIMQELLDLTNQIDSDTLSTVMEDFVEVFAEELSPFAIQLCEQLRDTFLRIMQDFQDAPASSGKEETHDSFGDMEINEKTMAATGVLKTITTLILNLESTPEVSAQLENALLPIITFTLKNTIAELYDDVFDIIDCCTFSTKQISTTMWGIFELIYNTFKGDGTESGIDYIEEMLPSLDNYMSYGTDVFLGNPHYHSMIYDIIDTVMKSDRLGENERICACKLIESMLLNCRGYVDQYVKPFLDFALHYLSDVKKITTLPYKIYCLEAVINCLYYNPRITIQHLEERGMTQIFFELWFGNISKFSRVHDKKLVIIALCTLIELPIEQLPHALQAGWPQVLDGILTVFKSLPKAEENRERMDKFGSEDDDYADEFDASEFNDADDEDRDDENIQDEDTKYLEFLAQEAAKKNPDCEDEDDDALEEDIIYESPLDKLDVYTKFHETFIGVQQHYPTSYSLLTKNLDQEKQNYIISLFEKAGQQKINENGSE
ncbi:16245_t:CDS:10 [Acaulospora colombiana]|uniref:16245_t:CDS:1 n=1 Tax=Acaulospora colombiana TaxID=27376 RepID=A0ACA9KWC8_9GLOM|nr:16245_t:CDS:10 [Acaulospora colombiana]